MLVDGFWADFTFSDNVILRLTYTTVNLPFWVFKFLFFLNCFIGDSNEPFHSLFWYIGDCPAKP